MRSKLCYVAGLRPVVVRNGAFGRLWASQLQSNLGTWLMVVAVPVFVFHLTGSPAGTTMALIAEAAPAIICAPLAGMLADRLDRRLVMAGSDALRAASVLCMFVVTSERQVWIIYIAAFAENSFAQFFDPSYRAIVPAVVGRGSDLDEANAWFSVSSGLVRLAGGPLGGLLYSIFGFHFLVLADCGTYVVSSLLVLSLPVSRPAERKADRPAIFTELTTGLRFLFAHAALRGLTVVSALFLFTNAALTIAVVPLIVSVLHRGVRDVGLLMAGLGVGYLVSAYLGSRLSASGGLRFPTVFCLVGADGAFAGLFNSTDLMTAMIFITLIGVFSGALLQFINVQLQRQTPDHLLGRTTAAMTSSQMLITVLGASLGGLLATSIGVVPMADLALVPVLAAAVLAWRTLPAASAQAATTAQSAATA